MPLDTTCQLAHASCETQPALRSVMRLAASLSAPRDGRAAEAEAAAGRSAKRAAFVPSTSMHRGCNEVRHQDAGSLWTMPRGVTEGGLLA